MSDPRKSLKTAPHWYFIAMIYCPVCASTKVYRERRYDERPDDYEQRHEVTEVYDYCNG